MHVVGPECVDLADIYQDDKGVQLMKRISLVLIFLVLVALAATHVYSASQVAWTILGETRKGEALEQFDRPDGESVSEVVIFGGKEARIVKTNAHSATDRYMYFKIDDDFAVTLKRNTDVWITIEYYDNPEVKMDDEGPNGIVLQYDSYNLQGVLMGAYTNAEEIAAWTKSGEWKTFTWHLKDARFSNRQNDGADFRLAAFNANPIILRKIAISFVAPDKYDFASLGE